MKELKFWLVVVAVALTATSLIVSHILVRDLQREEQGRMELWAEAMRQLSDADEHTDLSLVTKVIEGNNAIPVIVLDQQGHVTDYRNIADTTSMAQRMMAHGDSIRISPYQLLVYTESTLLRRLTLYPYWALGLVMIFAVVAIVALMASKRAEQNKVWVGLSKETAHQLGTPISSLMAWVEILKEAYPDDALIPEMDKDVKRLQRIAERFSKIGSLPEPQEESMNALLDRVIEYMDKRTSQKVAIKGHYPGHDVIVAMNASLFEWVIENLCKNAVDAMEGGSGRIDLWLLEEDELVVVEVADTGKGIKKNSLKAVFRPGYTTKKRGWGLGLSLAKRIVEEYHRGRIFVKASEPGKGTTFRVELRKKR